MYTKYQAYYRTKWGVLSTVNFIELIFYKFYIIICANKLQLFAGVFGIIGEGGMIVMKKALCIFLSLAILLLLCGCSGVDGNKSFRQEMTIVKMPSPPKCKTTDNITIINEVLAVLTQIEKTPTDDAEIQGGWNIMVKLDIDGQQFNYTIGGVFTDSDGRQYHVENAQEIEDKLLGIYNKIDAPEVDYP